MAKRKYNDLRRAVVAMANWPAIDDRITYAMMRRVLVKKFGEKNVPTASTIHRWANGRLPIGSLPSEQHGHLIDYYSERCGIEFTQSAKEVTNG